MLKKRPVANYIINFLCVEEKLGNLFFRISLVILFFYIFYFIFLFISTKRKRRKITYSLLFLSGK